MEGIGIIKVEQRREILKKKEDQLKKKPKKNPLCWCCSLKRGYCSLQKQL